MKEKTVCKTIYHLQPENRHKNACKAAISHNTPFLQRSSSLPTLNTQLLTDLQSHDCLPGCIKTTIVVDGSYNSLNSAYHQIVLIINFVALSPEMLGPNIKKVPVHVPTLTYLCNLLSFPTRLRFCLESTLVTSWPVSPAT